MCLILFGLDCHPAYQLVVAANRDEFYARASLPAAFWSGEPSLLAGTDLSHHGTWLGLTVTGRFAAITNYREGASNREDAPSRGGLVCRFLRSDMPAQRYLEGILPQKDSYNGFNLLAGTADCLYHYSNRMPGKPVRLQKGVHGLSNRFLDTPWPKVRLGKERLAAAMQAERLTAQPLFELLSDCTGAPDDELPCTGIPLEKERMLSPIFIKSPDYGTCVSTVVLIGRNGRAEFWERTFGRGDGSISSEVYYEFDLQQ